MAGSKGGDKRAISDGTSLASGQRLVSGYSFGCGRDGFACVA
jgi:hypothetical protein